MGQPRRIIVTADDFGVSAGVNRAVLDAHRAGSLTSASLAATGAAVAEALDIAARNPELEVGLHLVLAAGRPVSEPGAIPSLVTRDGRFRSRRELALLATAGRVDPGDVEREARAQMSRLRTASVSFLNGDQHVHVLPVIRDVVLRIAAEASLAVRVPREVLVYRPGSLMGPAAPRWLLKLGLNSLARAFASRANAERVPINDGFISPFGLFPRPRFTLDAFATILDAARGQVVELMVHPAYVDVDLRVFWPGVDLGREEELRALVDPAFPDLLAERGFHLASFADLARPGQT